VSIANPRLPLLEKVLEGTENECWSPKPDVECHVSRNVDGTWHAKVNDLFGCAYSRDCPTRDEAARKAHYVATGDEDALQPLATRLARLAVGSA
jgi:hypothetical protein